VLGDHQVRDEERAENASADADEPEILRSGDREIPASMRPDDPHEYDDDEIAGRDERAA
jgi:hypothetical protein